jgi:hypothetical protein
VIECDAKKVNLAVIQMDLQDPARQRNCKLRASVASIDDVPLPLFSARRSPPGASSYRSCTQDGIEGTVLPSGPAASDSGTVAETRGGGAVSERLCSANRTVSGRQWTAVGGNSAQVAGL